MRNVSTMNYIYVIYQRKDSHYLDLRSFSDCCLNTIEGETGILRRNHLEMYCYCLEVSQ